MTKRGDELLERAKRTQANWTISDLEQLYLQNGCDIIQGTKHRFARHPANPIKRATLPNKRKDFAKAYVRDAVDLIEEARQHER